jgi:hypothetical protein
MSFVRFVVRNGLNELNAQTLKTALSRAKNIYMLSDFKDSPNQNGVYRAGSAIGLFKIIKSIIRIPADEKITNENVASILHDLLSDWGGSDLASLKYQLFKALFPVRPARSDIEAERYVDIFKEEVNRLVQPQALAQPEPFTGEWFTLGGENGVVAPRNRR